MKTVWFLVKDKIAVPVNTNDDCPVSLPEPEHFLVWKGGDYLRLLPAEDSYLVFDLSV